MKYISLALFFILMSCSLPEYDAEEYKKSVDASVILDVDLCTSTPDKEKILSGAMDLKKSLNWLTAYSGSKPNDADSLSIMQGIAKENQGFILLLNTDISLKANLSQFYCQNKIGDIRHAFTQLLNEEARKPK